MPLEIQLKLTKKNALLDKIEKLLRKEALSFSYNKYNKSINLTLHISSSLLFYHYICKKEVGFLLFIIF
tara:strand:- start:2606 stop:2812 length:207 start_codon:yes stop_codon:yes gene_type:complete